MFFCFTPVNYIKIFWFTYRDQNAKRRTYPVLYGASVPYYVIGNKIKVLVVKRIISIFVATVATHFSFSFRFDHHISHFAMLDEIIAYFLVFVKSIAHFYLKWVCGIKG